MRIEGFGRHTATLKGGDVALIYHGRVQAVLRVESDGRPFDLTLAFLDNEPAEVPRVYDPRKGADYVIFSGQVVARPRPANRVPFVGKLVAGALYVEPEGEGFIYKTEGGPGYFRLSDGISCMPAQGGWFYSEWDLVLVDDLGERLIVSMPKAEA